MNEEISEANEPTSDGEILLRIPAVEYYVQYTVPILTGDQKHKQGPWPLKEAEDQLRDISGFDGVVGAHLRAVCDIIPCRHPDCSVCNGT